MDSRDLIILGMLGVGGWLAWRWYKRQPVANAQRRAPLSTAGMVASSMTDSGARSTVFGGPVFTKRLFDAVSLKVPQAKLPAPTAPASVVARNKAASLAPVQAQVTNAIFAPETTAPAGSIRHFISTGILGLQGTAPSGDGPQPGDPSPTQILQTRMIG